MTSQCNELKKRIKAARTPANRILLKLAEDIQDYVDTHREELQIMQDLWQGQDPWKTEREIAKKLKLW